jgi:hypothetical protein
MFRFLLLALIALVAAAAERGIRAQVVGGTIPGLAAKSNVLLDLTGSETLFCSSGEVELHIDYHRINTLEYGQNVSRRYAAAILFSPVLLLSKSRKHFITIGYTDVEGAQQAIVLRIEKGDIRSVLASLEARSGRRVEFQDEEARKSIK